MSHTAPFHTWLPVCVQVLPIHRVHVVRHGLVGADVAVVVPSVIIIAGIVAVVGVGGVLVHT